jgi:hypothetical protein
VARLLSSDFITKLTNGRLNILYGRGRRYAILESQINGRILAEMATEASNTLNEGAVTGSEQKVAPPITFRVHIPGAWCKFRVEKEGLIEEAKFKEGFPPQTIFGKNGKAKNIRGSENWYGSFVMAKEGATMKYQLRYQRGKISCFFYISIEEGLLVGRYDVLDVEIVKRRFLAACFPMLAWLEKHAGWRFDKDGTGNYVMLNEFTKDRLQSGYYDKVPERDARSAYIEDRHVMAGKPMSVPDFLIVPQKGKRAIRSTEDKAMNTNIAMAEILSREPAKKSQRKLNRRM